MKSLVRSYIERVLRHLPVSRAAFAERDALIAQLQARKSAVPSRTERLRISSRIERFEPRQLEELVPPMRSPEERTLMATFCRDADVLPRVANAGAVVSQED